MRKQPQWKRTALSSAVALALVSFQIPAQAACPGTVNNTTSTPCTLTGTQSVTVSAAGVMSGNNTPLTVGAAATGATITNSGTIFGDYIGIYLESGQSGTTITNNAGATIGALDSVSAYGIYVDGDFNGTITNAGTIQADATDSETVTAAGIYISGELSGSITNSGEITATGFSTDTTAFVYGIAVDGDVSGSISNSGTISATAITTDSTYAYAYGISVGGNLSGSISNSGTINATAITTSSYYAYAYGIYVGGDVSGSISNSGTINATAVITDTETASAFGIYVNGTLSGSISNSGTINATADGADEYAYAYGIYADTLASGATLSNSGTINATAISSYQGDAFGIYVYNVNEGAAISNSGAINATAITDDDYAYAYGIYVDNTLAGAITNTATGSITASATTVADSRAYAYGIYVDDTFDATGSITNNGSITATANASNYSATAYGIYVYEMIAGATITNSGSINVTATAGQSDAEAYGIYISDDLGGNLTNSGTITVTANAREDGDATGIYAYSILSDATLLNSGTLSVTANGTFSSASASGIDVDYIDGALTNSGTITVAANGHTWASAYGINGYILDGNLTNSGTITVSAISAKESATAYGIYVYNLNGSLTNSGSISVTASGVTSAWAYGIDTSTIDGSLINSGSITVSATDIKSEATAYGIEASDINGTLTNSGSITVSATGNSSKYGINGASAYAYGIYAGNISGSLSNSGSITATADAAKDWASAYGIYSWGTLTGTLENSGSITATASGDLSNSSESSAYGVYLSSLDAAGTFTNSGTITATVANGGSAYSIYLGGGVGTVSNSGTLTGSLYLNGTNSMDNTGSIHLPTNVRSSNYIGGNYTQSAAGVLGFGVMSAAEYAQLNVDGTADFAAGTTLNVAAATGYTLVNGDVLNDVVTASTLTSDGFNVTDNRALWSFAASIDGGEGGDTIDLTATRLSIADVARTGGASPATAGVAAALDTIYAGTPSEGMQAALDALGEMVTEAEVAAALEGMIPALSGQGAQMGLHVAGLAGGAVDSRMAGNRGQSSGDGMLADQHMWIKPFGNWADQDARSGVSGYDTDSYGVVLGLDGEVSSDLRVGAAFTYVNSDADNNSAAARNSVETDTYSATLYASRQLDDSTALDMQAGLGMGNHDSTRHITVVPSTATADYDSWHARLGAKLSRVYAVDDATAWVPYVRADYVHVDVDGYTETGAGALSLKVQGDDADSFVVGIGTDLTHQASEQLTLSATVGVGYDLMTDQSDVNASFINDGPVFTTRGSEPDETVLRAGLGAEYATGNNLDVTARYDIESRQDYKDQGVSLNLRWKF